MCGQPPPVALPVCSAPALHWSGSVAKFRTGCPKSRTGKFTGKSEVSDGLSTGPRHRRVSHHQRRESLLKIADHGSRACDTVSELIQPLLTDGILKGGSIKSG